jgi:hypothetical protein
MMLSIFGLNALGRESNSIERRLQLETMNTQHGQYTALVGMSSPKEPEPSWIQSFTAHLETTLCRDAQVNS